MVLAGWSGLAEIVARDGIPPSIAKAVQEGKAAYDTYQSGVDGLVAKLDGSGKPVVSPVDWDKTCQGPFNPIVDIAFTALDDAIADSAAGQAAAQQGLILSGLALAAALLIALFGIVTPSFFMPPKLHFAADEATAIRSEEHTSDLQTLMRLSYAV